MGRPFADWHADPRRLFNHFLSEDAENVRLLRGRTIHEVFAKQSLGTGVDITEAAEEERTLGVFVPFGQHEVDELGGTHVGGSGSVGPWQDQFGHYLYGRFLVRG